MIYVYALVDDPDVAVAGLRGLADAPLVTVSRGRVCAVCSLHDDLRLEGDATGLWQHERVTATLLPLGAVAPVQFGTVLAGMGAVEEMLEAQEARLVAVLARLRGKVELAVRGRVPRTTTSWGPGGGELDGGRRAPSPAPSATGRAYLSRLRETHGRPPEPAPCPPLADIHATLAGRAAASRSHAGADGTLVAAYLVGSGAVPSFCEAFIDARNRHPQVRVSLTGPWAPFSFVEEEGMAHV